MHTQGYRPLRIYAVRTSNMGSIGPPAHMWTHCSGASMQVPSIHLTNGLELSTTLRSSRPSWRPTSAEEGVTTTSGGSSDSATCRGGRKLVVPMFPERWFPQ